MDTQSLFNNDALIVYDTILNTEISLGMEMSNVDKLLGLQEKRILRVYTTIKSLRYFIGIIGLQG